MTLALRRRHCRMGANVTTISDQAFFTCPKLTSVILSGRVASVGSAAFAYCSGLTNVTLGKTVVSLGIRAFASCTQLTAFNVVPLNPAFTPVDGVLFTKSQTTLVCYPGGKAGAYVIPSGVTNLWSYAFTYSVNLTRVVIPQSLTRVPAYAFSLCSSLESVTIPATMTILDDRAFVACSSLATVYFCGNAPALGSSYVFYNANKATLYYLPGKTGWGPTFGGRPAVLWNPLPQTAQPTFGVQSNRFGFAITGTANIPIVVEATANVAGSTWTPLLSGTLTNGSIYFSDPDWTNYPSRCYRIRSP